MTVVDPTYYAEATEASILAKAALADAAGGGRVVIPAGVITLTQPLPAYEHVLYEGAPWGPDVRSDATNVGGTILQGDGSFMGYAYNEVDLEEPYSTFGEVISEMLVGPGLVNLTFRGFTYGIKIGALYNPGAQSLVLKNLLVTDCAEWGIWLENIWCSEIDHIIINNRGVGTFAIVGSTQHAIFNPGNTSINYLYGTVQSLHTRGACAWSRANSSLNQVIFTNLEIEHGPQTLISQAATMANGSANITVEDGDLFPVGLPVVFDATVNGLIGATAPPTNGQIYFVLTNDGGNVITVGSTPLGDVFVATGNTAVNIKSRGFALFEAAAQDDGSTLTAINVYSPDWESSTSMHALLVNTRYTSIIGGFIDGANNFGFFCLRGAESTQINVMRTLTIDDDAEWSANVFIGREGVDAPGLRARPVAAGNLGAAVPVGMRSFVFDATATTFHSIVAGGGSNKVPVFADGTNWRIG